MTFIVNVWAIGMKFRFQLVVICKNMLESNLPKFFAMLGTLGAWIQCNINTCSFFGRVYFCKYFIFLQLMIAQVNIINYLIFHSLVSWLLF